MEIRIYDEELGRFIGAKDQAQLCYKIRESKRQFNDYRHPMFWVFKEIEMYESAVALWDNAKSPTNLCTTATAFMLAGMSLEILLKALLMTHCKWPISDADLKRIAKGAHKLTDLLRETNIETTENGINLLSELSHYVRWKGRYPLPKTENELIQSKTGVSLFSQGELWEQYVDFRGQVVEIVFYSVDTWAAKQKNEA
jgi:hypothetical protein